MSLLERYHNKVEEYKNDPEKLTDYITQSAPYIQKYHEDNAKRRDIYVEYMRNVEKDLGVVKEDEIIEEQTDKCELCGSPNIFENHVDGNIVCHECGYAIPFFSVGLSFQDEQNTAKTNQYSYKRQNHFNEWVMQFQGKETANIPDEIIEQIRYELKKQRVDNVKNITHAKVRSLLKKLRQNKYYEHIPYITNVLTGVSPPTMDSSLEEKLRLMFNEVQIPFNKVKPDGRSNFLSYPYILYKFCELLGEDQYLAYFPLLKSKEKLHQQDLIWKDMCKILRWEYISTT